jgi:hypothetical protein
VGRHVYPWTVVSVSYHYKNQHVGLEQSKYHHLIENYLALAIKLAAELA